MNSCLKLLARISHCRPSLLRRNLFSTSQAELMEWNRFQSSFSPTVEFNIVSFNLLAPVYKRLSAVDITTGFRKRESQKEELWNARALRTADFFQKEVLGHTDIIGLQEFWMDSAYREIFEGNFRLAGYELFALKRPNQKLDGLVVVVKSSAFEVLGTEHIHLCGVGDRVALLLWLRHRDSGKDILVANTHLSFPHSIEDRTEQMDQMQALTRVIDDFASQFHITNASRIILGDFNVESTSPVCEHLRELGYLSCFEISPPANCHVEDDASQVDPGRFISHRTHRSEDLGVDHIFLKPEMDVADADRVFVSDCCVLPKGKGCGLWDETFRISDHRPVSAKIIFAQPRNSNS